MAASASTSHRALDTDAAAAKRLDSAGKNTNNETEETVPRIPPKDPRYSNHGNSTMAAVAAAHSELSALVNGNIAALRAP
mmetsp:Transcript_15547/g.29321  ORF Transcript_15547/g.29321 Transcript_15547/m.29321 type:complete len:80 (-) Transcript_15547:5318-5557(-)